MSHIEDIRQRAKGGGNVIHLNKYPSDILYLLDLIDRAVPLVSNSYLSTTPGTLGVKLHTEWLRDVRGEDA